MRIRFGIGVKRTAFSRLVSATTKMRPLHPGVACAVQIGGALQPDDTMAKCDVCGNNYDKPLVISLNGKQGTFDSFECAIHALAPTCAHCKCRVIGHGVEANGVTYCCAHCAHHSGATKVRDNEAHSKPT